MPFRPIDLHDLDVAREVRVETHGKSGEGHSTNVWIMVDGDAVFLRSVRGAQGRWYQEALARRVVVVDDGGRRLEAVVEYVDDAETLDRVDAAITRKYAQDPGARSMLTAEARLATLRLEPRTSGEDALQGPSYLGSDEPSELHGRPIELGMMDSGAPIDPDVFLQPRKPA